MFIAVLDHRIPCSCTACRRPLPRPKTVSAQEAVALNRAYEDGRRAYRALHPHRTLEQSELWADVRAYPGEPPGDAAGE